MPSSIGSPTPWWQLPGQGRALTNLQTSAPAGYTYDPVKMSYIQTPESQGGAVKAFTEAAMPDSLKGLMGTLTGSLSGSASAAGGASGGTSTGGGLSTSPAGSGLARIARPTAPDATTANNGAFATAKDQAGKIARSSIDSLRGELGATGNLGGGAEVEGVRGAVMDAAGIEGQASRDIAMKTADQNADFAKTGYLGDISQRGQDVSAAEAEAQRRSTEELARQRLAFETSNANSQRQLQLLTLALSGLKGASSGLSY